MALLAYLAVTTKVHSRDSLAALFWADYDQSRARSALRRTLSVLNKALREDTLEITRDRLGLAQGAALWFDVEEFQRLLKERETHGHPQREICSRCLDCLEKAVELYRGDFMSGFTLRDSPEFDDWQYFQTDSLRRELAGALEQLAHGLAAKAEYERAIVHARHRVALDPLHEAAHRQLMQLYAWAGQQSAALRQYQECTRILDKELGVPPMPETTQLYQAIKEQRAQEPLTTEYQFAERPQSLESIAPTPSRAAAHMLPLVGRWQEMASIKDNYAGIQSDGYFQILEGEAGIGKTRLAEEFLSEAGTRGAFSIMARCYSGESNLAYAPFLEGLRAALAHAHPNWHQPIQAHWLVEAARLLPELSRLRPDLPAAPSLDSPGAQTRFFEGVSQVLQALCDSQPPGILFFDDLQWADEASLDLLTYLVRRLHGRRLFVLAVWRGEDLPMEHRLRRLLAEAQRNGYASAITLSRLDTKSIMELVKFVAGEAGLPLENMTLRLFEETEGLPFFITEYLATLPEVDTGLQDDWTMPQGVRDILHSRIDALDDAGRQLLQTAAVIGRSFDFETLQYASGRSEEETTTTLEALIASGLIRETQPGRERRASDLLRTLDYDFSHDKTRALVYEETSQGRRRLLHQRVADGLLRHSRSRQGMRLVAGQLAYHYLQSGRAKEAAEYSKLAGEHARSVYANTEALAHYQAAIALGHPDIAELEEAMGDLYTLLGNYEAALGSYQTAAGRSTASSQGISRMRHKMGDIYHRRGEWELAEDSFQAAAQDMKAQDDAARLSRLYADWSRTMRRRGQLERALHTASQSLDLAEKVDDDQALAQAHNILGMLLRSQGNLDEAIMHLERSLLIAEKLPEPGIRIAALNNLSLAYAEHDELQRALAYTQQALELCAIQGDRHRAAALHSNLADLYHSAGQEEQSMAHLKQAVVIFSEIGASETERPRPEIWKLTEW